MNEEIRYSPRVKELFATLPGGGPLGVDAGPTVVVGEARALDRGAWVRFEARVANGRIEDCRFRAWGCPHTLASAAWAALEIRGRAASDLTGLDAMRIRAELDVPPEKMGRLLVVEDALRSLSASATVVK